MLGILAGCSNSALVYQSQVEFDTLDETVQGNKSIQAESESPAGLVLEENEASWVTRY
jgi:hypothetical protein